VMPNVVVLTPQPILVSQNPFDHFYKFKNKSGNGKKNILIKNNKIKNKIM